MQLQKLNTAEAPIVQGLNPSALDSNDGLKEEVLSYQNEDLIARLKRKEGLSDAEARVLFSDLLQFLYVCGTTDQICAPTEKIDIAWHHFILFTRDYADFCLLYFGSFIHHNPRNSAAPSDILIRTVTQASKEFGKLSENWKIGLEGQGAFCSVGPYECGSKCSGSTNCQD